MRARPEERPMLFSTAMVLAILARRKQQTRRVMQRQPSGLLLSPDECYPAGCRYGANIAADRIRAWRERLKKNGVFFGEEWGWTYYPCPYGGVGSNLWVRETWAYMWPESCDNGLIYDEEHPGGRIITDDECRVVYRADSPNEKYPGGWHCGRWKPSIHMKRKDSRINLEILALRAERLQDITIADAIAEGIEPVGSGYRDYSAPAGTLASLDAVASYRTLWDSITAKNGKGWETNPWVWVLSFKPIFKESINAAA